MDDRDLSRFAGQDEVRFALQGKPESTEGGPWGQPLKQPEGAPLNLG